MAIQTTVQNTSFRVGDTIKVYQKFKVGDKTQTQGFEGTVIAIKGRQPTQTFTVRKISADSVGVEKIWPVKNPNLTKVTLRKKGNVRRAKLYYLRQRTGKEALKVKGRK